MGANGPLAAIRRLDLGEEARDLAARCIVARHPKGVALGRFSPGHYDDEGLMEIALRLHSWLSRQSNDEAEV